jgi:hypothetical protein
MFRKLRNNVFMITLIAFMIGSPSAAEAKAFGWQTTSQSAVSSGGCLYHVVTESYYFFGIVISTRSNETLVGCDNTPPEPCYDRECVDANSE